MSAVSPLLMQMISSFLSALARFLTCRDFWCALAQLAAGSFAAVQTPYVIPRNPAVVNPLRHVAAIGDNLIVLTWAVGHGSERGFLRQLTSVGPAPSGEPAQVRIPFTPHTIWTEEPGSEAFFVTGTSWWYATLDERGGDKDHAGSPSVTFLQSDGSRATYAKVPIEQDPSFSGAPPDPDFTESRSWRMAAIPGDKPRVLALTLLPGQTIVQEIDGGGAAKSWRLPSMRDSRLIRIAAQPLPDGRIALFVSDGGLSMYELGTDNAVNAIPLRNVVVDYFDAVIDGSGRVAIVAAHNPVLSVPGDTGSIDAAVFNSADPDRVQWQSIRRGVRVAGGFQTTRIVPISDGYTAVWVNDLDKSRIEAANVDLRGHGGPVVAVGHAAARGKGAFFDVQSRGDDVLLWWDDEVHLIQRRLPASIAGFAVIRELAQLCSDKPHAGAD